jgi:hypothetical protein
MEATEFGMLRWLEDGPTGSLGRFDDRNDLFLRLDHLGEREPRRADRRGRVLTDVSFERVSPEEAEK